jgi:hypothetical protein
MMNEGFGLREYGAFSPEKVIAENLHELDARADILEEQEIAHLRELATEIALGDDIADLLSSLPYYRIAPTLPAPNALAGNLKLLSRSRGLLEAKQCIILAHALYDELKGREDLSSALFPDAEEIAPHAAGRIVYQKSSYTDDAYLAFATLVPQARAAYAHSAHSVCEDVYNGHCEYCILPIENAVEGELVGFAKLIAKYDLKIAACCDIVGTDASRQTRFALLRRNILPLFVADAPKNEYFRFSLPFENSDVVAEVLSAAKFYGLQFISMNTHPDGEITHFNLTFSIRGGDIYPFLLYLATVAPQYTPIGIYSHINRKGI